MITRSRASYVSALDPSCPVKSEEPENLTAATVFMQVSRLQATATPSLCQEPWVWPRFGSSSSGTLAQRRAKLLPRIALIEVRLRGPWYHNCP